MSMYVHGNDLCMKFYQTWLGLTLNQPGSGKSVNYRGPFGFHEVLTHLSRYLGRMYRALRFWESAQNGAATIIGPLRKSETPARLITHHPPHSTQPGTWNWSEFYWRRTALRTTARRDFSRARVVRNSCKTGRKWGWWHSSDATELLTKIRQNGRQNDVFWCHVRSSKRFGRRFCRNRLNKK